MPGEEKSLDELVGLLGATPPSGGSDEADDASGTGTDGGGDPGDETTIDVEVGGEADADGNPDEGTDDGEPDGDEGEGQDDEDEGDEPSTEPLYTVKIDGKDERVTLKEALAGYSRTKDYTRKTEAIAEERKTLDATATELRTNRDRYAAILEQIEARLGPEEGERTEEQWNQLRQDDPDRYAVEYTDYQRRQGQRQAVKAEKERVAGEQRAEQVKELRSFVAKQGELLLDKVPAWKDPAKFKADREAIMSWAQAPEIGFTEAELSQVYDHRMLILADKARRYDALMAARAKAKQKVADAPEMPAPASREPRAPTGKVRRDAALKRVKQSGAVDDAVDLI